MSGSTKHQARIGAWSSSELRAQLVSLMDDLDDEKGSDLVSPLDVALELLSGELECFLLVGRVGHLDPPREDGKIPFAFLEHQSDDPVVTAKLREAVAAWVDKKTMAAWDHRLTSEAPNTARRREIEALSAAVRPQGDRKTSELSAIRSALAAYIHALERYDNLQEADEDLLAAAKEIVARVEAAGGAAEDN